MADTLATCEVRTAATATLADWFTEIDTFFTSTATVFTKNGASTSTALLLDHPDGWQLLLRNNGTNLLTSIDPDGAITNLAGIPTGSASYSGEDVSFVATNVGTTIHLAEYPDAILIGFKNTSSNFWQQGIHAGKVYTPFNASDPSIFIDGFAIVAGLPKINLGASGDWILGSIGTQTNPGLTRITQTVWSAASIRAEILDCVADVDSKTKLIPIIYAFGSSSSATLNVSLGPMKYIRRYKTSSAHRTLLPSTGLSDQAFMIFSGTTSNTQFCCLWSKAVTP